MAKDKAFPKARKALIKIFKYEITNISRVDRKKWADYLLKDGVEQIFNCYGNANKCCVLGAYRHALGVQQYNDTNDFRCQLFHPATLLNDVHKVKFSLFAKWIKESL